MHKRRYGSLIWGGLLVIVGVLFLIDNLGLLGDWNTPIWSLILGIFGLVFVAIFFSDREQWWALIPGLVILGTAVAVFLAEQELVDGYVVATIILAGVGLPFLLIYLSDRQHWWALIPAMTMTGVATGVLLEGIGAISGEGVAGFVLGGISLGFVSIYLIDREQWWALIPGGAMGIMAVFFVLATAGKYAWPVALILLGILLLRGSLRGGRRRARRTAVTTADVKDVPRSVREAESERQRLPTLEEQIKAAITEGPTTGETDNQELEPTAGMPPAPEIPEPPEVPSGPEVA